MPTVDTIPGLNVDVRYSTDGRNFHKIPYAGSFSTSGGDPDTVEGDTFDGLFKRVGKLKVPDATIEFPSYAAAHQSWVELQKAAKEGKFVDYDIQTAGEEHFAASGAANTAAIAVDGAVTFTGKKPDPDAGHIGPGMQLAIGNTKYTIDEVSDTGAAKVRPVPKQAVAAAPDYKIVTPSLKLKFRAAFASHIHASLEVAGVLSTTLNLSLTAPLPAWEIA